MLIDFFLHLKTRKLPVSTREFLTLLEALQAHVCGPSIDDFYVLARACLVKDESLYDRFDQAFGEYFKGVTEIPGPRHNSKILGWLQKLRAWWADDETPWCGVFVAHCMQESGLPLPRFWMRATDWLNWGAKLAAPVAGCVVVFQRPGGGHVGFVTGPFPGSLDWMPKRLLHYFDSYQA